MIEIDKSRFKKDLPVTAFILVGGIGSRLQSIVSDRPKPMVLINDKPFLSILIELIVQQGIKKIVLLTGYLSTYIENYISNYNNPDVTILISKEDVPLGTGGAVRNALKFVSDFILLVNGDSYFNLNIMKLYNFHLNYKPDVTLSLCKSDNTERYGTVIVDSIGRIKSFQEKPESLYGPGLINAGFSMLSSQFIESLPSNKSFSMEKEIFPSLVKTKKIYGVEQPGVFFDIGTPESYFQFVDYYNL